MGGPDFDCPTLGCWHTLGWVGASTVRTVNYEFDRFLRYDELTEWLHHLAGDHPSVVAVEEYGHSYEGRPLWLVTVTDSSTGPHDAKPAHWVDASIHAVELTGTVAACFLLRHLVDGFTSGDPVVTDLALHCLLELWSQALGGQPAG